MKYQLLRIRRRPYILWPVVVLFLLVFTISGHTQRVPQDMAFFVGIWSVAVKDGKGTVTWTVKEDLGGEWLSGTVDRDGERISIDHWRFNGRNIERFAFTADGLYIKMNASGWKGNKLSFAGIASGPDGDFRMRETITRENDKRFRALWEKQGADGVWVVYSDETCSK